MESISTGELEEVRSMHASGLCCVVVRNAEGALCGMTCKHTSGVWLAAKNKVHSCITHTHVHMRTHAPHTLMHGQQSRRTVTMRMAVVLPGSRD